MSKSEKTSQTAKIKLKYENWRFFPWTDDFKKGISEDGTFDGKWNRLIEAVRSEENKRSLMKYKGYVYAATELAKRLTEFSEVQRITLFGSLAKPPYKEPHPYSKSLREKGVTVFHQPHDIDLAVWLSSLENIRSMRQTCNTVANEVMKKAPGLSCNAIELFVFDAQSNQYLGRICYFSHCPKGHNDCCNKGCGHTKYLKTLDDFTFHPDALSKANSQLLFSRKTSNENSLPANLLAGFPKKLPEELTDQLVVSKNVRIERIVSTGQASPENFWYDQPEHEWVVVLQGKAMLEFETQSQRLSPGDHVLIPAHQKHRINWTSTTELTVWLAVFFDGELEGG